MAYPEANLVARLKAFAGLTALVSDRIVPVMLLQYQGRPAVVFERTATEFYNTAGGTLATAQATIEVSCIAADYTAAKGVAEQTRLALGGWTDGSGWLWHQTAEYDDAEVVADGEGFPLAFLVHQTYVLTFDQETS